MEAYAEKMRRRKLKGGKQAVAGVVEDETTEAARLEKRVVRLSQASTALARRWLRAAQDSIQARFAASLAFDLFAPCAVDAVPRAPRATDATRSMRPRPHETVPHAHAVAPESTRRSWGRGDGAWAAPDAIVLRENTRLHHEKTQAASSRSRATSSSRSWGEIVGSSRVPERTRGP